MVAGLGTILGSDGHFPAYGGICSVLSITGGDFGGLEMSHQCIIGYALVAIPAIVVLGGLFIAIARMGGIRDACLFFGIMTLLAAFMLMAALGIDMIKHCHQ
jgi:hypothetical protein